MKILIIEDEKKVSAFIRKGLEEDGYETDAAYDGEEGATKASAESSDLIVLDIQMPKKDGLTLLQELRDAGITTPVLMLTARSTIEDRVKGLDTGADDYLVKPFAVDELLARVRSLLRRGAPEKATTLSAANLDLDIVQHKAMRGGEPIELTAKEYLLLEYFMRNKNKVLSRSMISQHIWNYNFDTGTNIIDVYVSHLRTKIDGASAMKLIHTVRGVGYVMKETT